MIKVFACAAAAMVLALGGAACGGDDDDGGIGDATPGLSGTPFSNPTPFPTPMITGSEINSPAKGYAATIPPGWTVRINNIFTADGSADILFEPLQQGAQAQASIVINCIVERGPGTEAERYAAEQTVVNTLTTNRDIVTGTMSIAGLDAPTITYTVTSQQNPDQPLVRKTDVYFESNACDYELTFSAPVDRFPDYQDDFAAFAQAFRLLD